MKIQHVLVCILLLLNSAYGIDPGPMMRAYGLNIDISRLINKITSGLYQQNEPGIQIRSKSSASCLDAYTEYGTNGVAAPAPAAPAFLSYREQSNGLGYSYGPAAAACDSDKSTQKWKINNGRLQTWTRGPVRDIIGGSICLDCTSGAENCYVESKTCNASRIQQQFYVRVHARQLDIMTDRIYFSLHSGANRKRCITSYYSTEKGGQTYALDRCSGSDEQSFYINQDYSVEIQSVKSRVRVCASDSYAPACRSLYCPGK